MYLHVGNINTQVTNATEDELRWLYAYLSIDTGKARFNKNPHWDGKLHLFSLVTKKFLTGLLSLVQKGADRKGFITGVVDHRVDQGAPPDLSGTGWLDPLRHQPQALAAAISAGRGVIWSPTGGGKTEIMVALASAYKQTNWLICVPSIDLLDQTVARYFTRTAEEAGKLGDGVTDIRRVTVASFQTLFTRIRSKDKAFRQWLATIGGVCWDECHTLAAASFMLVPQYLPNASLRFGFSGTPLSRGDKRNAYLIGHAGPVVYKVPTLELIKAGVLSKPTIRYVRVEQTVPGFDWQSVYKAGVVDSVRRNNVLVKIAEQAQKPALLFVKEIAHGLGLRRMLLDAGVKADFLSGRDSADSRASTTKRLVRGDIDVLVVSTIYDQGVDIPELRTVILGGGGNSAIKALQRPGRAMRVLADGSKKTMDLWDIFDAGNHWLEKHSAVRRQIYVQQSYEVTDFDSRQMHLSFR